MVRMSTDREPTPDYHSIPLQAMGGDIRVESQLDEGSRFTFWLPSSPDVT